MIQMFTRSIIRSIQILINFKQFKGAPIGVSQHVFNYLRHNQEFFKEIHLNIKVPIPLVPRVVFREYEVKKTCLKISRLLRS